MCSPKRYRRRYHKCFLNFHLQLCINETKNALSVCSKLLWAVFTRALIRNGSNVRFFVCVSFDLHVLKLERFCFLLFAFAMIAHQFVFWKSHMHRWSVACVHWLNVELIFGCVFSWFVISSNAIKEMNERASERAISVGVRVDVNMFMDW